MKILSIVIVNWNTRKLLFDLLTSLFKHAPRRDFEVIVVDNASTDGSREMVAAEFPSVRLLVNQTNEGFASANNRAIRESRGEYVLLLNTDMVVLEGAIDTQVAFMESNPECAGCGGLLLNGDGAPGISYGRFPSVRRMLVEILPYRMGGRALIGTFSVPAIDQTLAMPVDIISGADLMARRAALERIGLLDERFYMYFEDADWCLRAKRDGWDVYYVPSVRYIHYGSQSTTGWSSHQQQWLTSLGLFLRKHYHGAQLVACWLLWLFLRAKFFLWRIRTRIQPGLSLEAEA
jgi:GT2 family glycosyltransferase